MLIPTLVEELSTLAVPGSTYWCETAAQYYVNAPGVGVDEACVWGSSSNPVGNWSPYTAGANTASNGDTYLKIGWNPIYLEPATPFRNVKPDFGLEILCDGDGCNGLPCRIDPSSMGVNKMHAAGVFTGAGGATGCVVTVPSGAKAQIAVFDASSSGLHLGKSLKMDDSSKDSSSSSSSSTSTSISSTSTSASTSTSSSHSTSTAEPTTSSSTSESSSTKTSSSSTRSATMTVTSTAESTSISASTFNSEFYSTQSLKASSTMGYTYRPHVFTGSADIEFATATTSSAPAASTSSSHNSATSATVSLASILLASIATLALTF